MFTTGVHAYLYFAIGSYIASFILYLFRARPTGMELLIIGVSLQSLYLLGRGWLGFEGPFLLPWCLALIPLTSIMGLMIWYFVTQEARRNNGKEG